MKRSSMKITQILYRKLWPKVMLNSKMGRNVNRVMFGIFLIMLLFAQGSCLTAVLDGMVFRSANLLLLGPDLANQIIWDTGKIKRRANCSDGRYWSCFLPGVCGRKTQKSSELSLVGERQLQQIVKLNMGQKLLKL